MGEARKKTDLAREIAHAETLAGGHHSELHSVWKQVNGYNIHARISTDVPADAPPVVLVPGLNVSSRHMAPIGTLLTPTYRAYAPDLPGFGLSEHPRSPMTIEQLAATLSAWMDALGLTSAAVLGASYGAQIVTHLALRQPERVSRLILLSPTLPPEDHFLPVLLWKWLRNQPHEGRTVKQITREDYKTVSRYQVVYSLAQMLGDHIERRLPRLHMPTLVLRGTKDPISTQTWVDHMYDLLPNPFLAIVAGASHSMELDRPVLAADIIRVFLSGQLGRESARTEA